MAWYKTGTVTVNNGETSVSATGTKFATNSRVGDGFRGPDGEWYEITNIASETVLGIYPAYQGPSVVDSLNYMIAPLQGYNKESADRLREITMGMRDITSEVKEAKDAADAARLSEVNAKTSETNSKTSETNAKNSETAAATSQGQAQTSATNARNSEVNAKTSETNSKASENAALASQTAAKTSETNAKTSENNAKASETAANTSAVNAKASENDAKTSETNSKTSETNAKISETNSKDSENKSVTAKTSAEKARDEAVAAAGSVTGNITDMGGWDASTGVYPAKPAISAFWKVTGNGSATDNSETIQYGIGDTLMWSKPLNLFYKIDNTESVSSVAGKTGAVTLVNTDITNFIPAVKNIMDTYGMASSGMLDVTEDILRRISQTSFNFVRPSGLGQLPTQTNYYVIHLQLFNAGYATQLAIEHLSGRQYTRGKDNGVWSAWRTEVAIGDFGIGAKDNAVYVGNGQDPNTYTTAGTYAGQFSIDGVMNTGSLIVQAGSNSTAAAQQFVNWANGRMFSRGKSGNVWSTWREALAAGDYGVGSKSLTFLPDANVVSTGGIVKIAPTTANSPGFFGTLQTDFYDAPTGNFTQIALENGSGVIWSRGGINGSIGTWVRRGCEYVTNGNGKAVKFEDGTMICWFGSGSAGTSNQATGTLFVSQQYTYTFPVPFVDFPAVSWSTSNGSSDIAWATHEGSNSTLTIGRLVSTKTGVTGYPQYIAIGRWK